MLPSVSATRYVAPLREGGSLPGLVEADDLGIYVVKFTGAGQGRKALVAEVVVGELARRLGFRVPDLVAVELDAVIGRYEADEEVQDLLTASVGVNLGVDFLPGSLGYDGSFAVEPDLAARILWLDAFTANVDRSWRNPNLLVWHRNLWCIDHGSALYFHHAWRPDSVRHFATQAYDATSHVLAAVVAGHPSELAKADAELSGLVSKHLLEDAVAQVPDEWLEPAGQLSAPADVRALYVEHLLARAAAPRNWLLESVRDGRTP